MSAVYIQIETDESSAGLRSKLPSNIHFLSFSHRVTIAKAIWLIFYFLGLIGCVTTYISDRCLIC